MILKDILNGVSGTLLQGDLQQEINSITIDSRKTESNVLFVAIKGMRLMVIALLVELMKRDAELLLLRKMWKIYHRI